MRIALTEDQPGPVSRARQIASLWAIQGHDVLLLTEYQGDALDPRVQLVPWPIPKRVLEDVDVLFVADVAGILFGHHWTRATGKPAVVQIMDLCPTSIWDISPADRRIWAMRAECASSYAAIVTLHTVTADGIRNGFDPLGRTFSVPPTFVVPYGVDVDRMDHALEASPQARNRNVASVGRFVHLRGHDKAIEAVAAMGSNRCPVDVAAFPGPDRERLRQLAVALGVDVRFLDLSESEKYNFLARSGAGVCLAFNPFVASIIPDEMTYCGIPTLVADTPVMRERCGDRVTYVPPWDSVGAAAWLQKWIGEASPRTARAEIRATRSIEAQAHGILKVLQGVV